MIKLDNNQYRNCYWGRVCEEIGESCGAPCECFTPEYDDEEDTDALIERGRAEFRAEFANYLYRFYNER